MPWTSETVQSIGRSRALHFEDYLRRGERAREDAQKHQRIASRECRYCYYVSHDLAGQAFTEWQCMSCVETQMHSNTAVPKLCDKCADNLEACVRCGGSREWQTPSEEGKPR